MRKIRVRYRKEGRAAYLSHLDTMRTFQRALHRAEIPLKHSEGFNPHAYLSFALPLSLGFTSEWELMDCIVLGENNCADIAAQLNRALPEGFTVEEVYEEGRKVREIASARYQITCIYDQGVATEFLGKLDALFSTPPLNLMKKSKRGEKQVDILSYIKRCTFSLEGNTVIIDACLLAGNDNLNPEYLVRAIETYLPAHAPDFARFHRLMVYDENFEEFR